MGRKRESVDLIEDLKIRRVTFNKRKLGLFKKMMEICKLCDSQGKLILFSDSGELSEFDSHSGTDTLRRYLQHVEQNRRIESFTLDDYDRVKEQTERCQKGRPKNVDIVETQPSNESQAACSSSMDCAQPMWMPYFGMAYVPPSAFPAQYDYENKRRRMASATAQAMSPLAIKSEPASLPNSPLFHFTHKKSDSNRGVEPLMPIPTEDENFSLMTTCANIIEQLTTSVSSSAPTSYTHLFSFDSNHKTNEELHCSRHLGSNFSTSLSDTDFPVLSQRLLSHSSNRFSNSPVFPGMPQYITSNTSSRQLTGPDSGGGGGEDNISTEVRTSVGPNCETAFAEAEMLSDSLGLMDNSSQFFYVTG
jgi:hypothetical protein